MKGSDGGVAGLLARRNWSVDREDRLRVRFSGKDAHSECILGLQLGDETPQLNLRVVIISRGAVDVDFAGDLDEPALALKVAQIPLVPAGHSLAPRQTEDHISSMVPKPYDHGLERFEDLFFNRIGDGASARIALRSVCGWLVWLVQGVEHALLTHALEGYPSEPQNCDTRQDKQPQAHSIGQFVHLVPPFLSSLCGTGLVFLLTL